LSIRFRLLTEADVKVVLTMEDLIEVMASAVGRFSAGFVEQPIRSVISVDGNHAFFATMPAFVRGTGQDQAANFGGAGPLSPALGAKLVTVFGGNTARGLHSHLASVVLLDPETGALLALLDGRYITEARTAAVSAVSSRLLARKGSSSLAIIGSGVQARSHLDALSRVHDLRQVRVWSPNREHRERFASEARSESTQSVRRVGSESRVGLEATQSQAYTEYAVTAVDHAGEAVVGADVIVLATASSMPVIENGWVKPGAHVISVGAARPTQREMDPALIARARLFVDSRAAALVESGDIVMGIQEGWFTASHIVAELGELVGHGTADAPPSGRTSDHDLTIFKSLGLAVEDVTTADFAYRRAVERGIGRELEL
jgi:ornithine cyclodeaminase/alanine dehydrogenase-like protein (mu-crystallin family)